MLHFQSTDVPPTRLDTAQRVAALRALFAQENIQAYLIPNEDAHQVPIVIQEHPTYQPRD